MPCEKKSLVKNWDRPRDLRVIKQSRYEKNEASVKLHWKNVLLDLETSYKDDKFWESNANVIRELVGPNLFKRLAKIYDLPDEGIQYEAHSDITSLVPSEIFYVSRVPGADTRIGNTFSMTDFGTLKQDLEQEETMEEESEWTMSTPELKSRPASRSRSIVASKALLKSLSSKLSTFSYKSKTMMKTLSSKKSFKSDTGTGPETARTSDDLDVHAGSHVERRRTHLQRNPFFTMLYCNESETDMIKWKSKYKQKTFEVSASDEFSKKAEIVTKKIAKEFFDWWVGLGSVEFKSEIKRPQDIEDLFQVWFDEHASRGIVLDPKILPCVLQSIADYVKVYKSSCQNVLKRHIAYDINAETSPAHTKAFGTCLPQKLKHLPPRNNTEQMWHSVKIPEDLRSMAAVWQDISYLKSTKEFQKWLEARPHLPMPPCLRKTAASGGVKKQLFVIPSDFIARERSTSSSTHDLALPVSEFALELKTVLSKLMKD